MAIPRDEPYITPPEPEKTYDSIWLNNISIEMTQTEGRVNIKCLPYDSTTQELNMGSEGGIEYITTRDLWKAIDEVPEVKDAMDAITAAIVPLREWINTETLKVVGINPSEPEPDPTEPVDDEEDTEPDPALHPDLT
jgi:hypothetical protein|tara:strand:- start:76 stop:486 length:411 start_codon:yes stop_codon:yes gene_type:complete